MKTLSEQQLARLLVGKEVEVSVGEPWDFEYPGGGTGLRGRVSVVRPVDDEGSKWGVHLELDTPFVSEEGPIVRSLIAKRRYFSVEGIVEMLAAGERVSADLSYSHEVSEDARLPGQSPFLIGSVRLAE